MKTPLTLKTIRATNIDAIIQHLNLKDLNSGQCIAILKICLLFLNSNNDEIKEFGYRILLKLCNKTRNYIPLYDVATNLGYIPIANMLKRGQYIAVTDSFIHTLMDGYRERFRQDDNYQTENQKELFDSFSDLSEQTVAVVAPTSYGKSQLIEFTVQSHPSSNIGIVVPSKALISQTRRRVLEGLPLEKRRQVIVHHDMNFSQDKPIVAIVTQERLLRMFQKYPSLQFDILFIDEAHNLLSGDKRSRLLASAIIIAKSRCKSIAIKYLTPFLVTSDSLNIIADTPNIKEIKINEKLKTEDYYICDFSSGCQLRFYDQFLNKFFDIPEAVYSDDTQLLFDKKKQKNVVYLNKPKDIEEFAQVLCEKLPTRNSKKIEKLCEEIADYVHPSYRILDCLRKGLAYHHGSIPDSVRTYIENAFRHNPSISWIVTSSTLLEGVNIPADVLFILDPRRGPRNLKPSEFRNLVGRINRFSEIFDPENGVPQLLIPDIYLISSNYTSSKANIEKFIQHVAKIDLTIEDEIENPLLAGSGDSEDTLSERDEDLTFIENIEPNASWREEAKLANSEVGRLCFIHNIYELDILRYERLLAIQVDELIEENRIVKSSTDLMDIINELFISKIDDDRKNENLLRLRNSSARGFYSMFFDWRINQVNYQRMIGSFVRYWKAILKNEDDALVYAGRWGNVARSGHIANYIDLKALSEYEMINLAIVRIKEEQDFVDNNLVKFVEVVNDLNLLDHDIYNKVKYGTTDKLQIGLIRSGLSHIAANVLASKYIKYVTLDSNGSILISNDIKQAFRLKNEKELISSEVLWSGLLG